MFQLPRLALGTTSLGNLFRALPAAAKGEIVEAWFTHVPRPVFIDSAGKYGAGMALECLGRQLERLNIEPVDVVISNKLAWRRVPLTGPEPTFEPGAWVDLQYDAVQDISYDGILRCWEEGERLLGRYHSSLASVHDPDEFLAAAASPADRDARLQQILEAYRALQELKAAGQVAGVGVGAKDWTSIAELAGLLSFDWVMMANSLTILAHPPELLELVERLHQNGVQIINSAVFHAGFLVGGEFFDYRRVDPQSPADQQRLAWREQFWQCCRQFNVAPADACVAFAQSPPGVTTIALSSSRPQRVADHVACLSAEIPPDFWQALKDRQLIAADYPYL